MAIILCLETATDVCSIGLSVDGRLRALQESVQMKDHASQITLLIEKCLAEAKLEMRKLDAVAVSTGPGSYTSLRIGWSTAKGIAYALSLPLLAIDTLQAISVGAYSRVQLADAWYCPMIDARRMEVYYALYRSDGSKVFGPEALVLEPGVFDTRLEEAGTIVFTGNGAAKFQPICTHPGAVFYPLEAHAGFFSSLAETAFREKSFTDLAYDQPLYLKPPNITKPKALI